MPFQNVMIDIERIIVVDGPDIPAMATRSRFSVPPILAPSEPSP
jgi:hypothetical protein